MPLKAGDAMAAQFDPVTLAGQPGADMAELWRRFGVSGKACYYCCRRFAELGAEWLLDRSRRPKISPRRAAETVEATVVDIGRANPPPTGSCGGRRKIRRVLHRDVEATSAVAAASTMTGLLRRGGRLKRETSAAAPLARLAALAPNLLSQMDVEGHVALDGRIDDLGERCFALTVLDDQPRHLLRARACTDEKQGAVRERSTWVVETHGLSDALPVAMLTDKANPPILKLGFQ